MQSYDIGIGWASPYERAFAQLMKEEASRKRKSVREITFETLADDVSAIASEELQFSTYIDRGSIDDPGFTCISAALRARGTNVINDPLSAARAASKATLHPLLEKAKIPLPKTFIVNAKTSLKELRHAAEELGAPFVVTSSYGAGETDDRLLLTGETAEDIVEMMENNFQDQFLAHEYIRPRLFQGHSAWWRPIYARGTILHLWWDPLNHFYEPVGNTKQEEELKESIEAHMHAIAEVAGLTLFSSEFAMTEQDELLLIDYANQPIDLDSSENISGGLPPAILEEVASLLVN